MRIASWNINSLRLRLPLIKRFLEACPVEVLCLQETKTPDEHFPAEALTAMGMPYHVFHGEKSYNGVAILSRLPLEPLARENFGGVEHARHTGARLPDGVELHNLYIPAGGDIPDPEENPKFAHKLRYVEDLTAWSRRQDRKRTQIILGDFNIAPLEHDVWSSRQLRDVVSHTDIERTRLAALKEAGEWTDSHRHFVPEDRKLYSWWSYRARDWQTSDRGRRLDHLWVSPALKDRLHSCETLAAARGWEGPSDHVPIVTRLCA